MAEEMKSGRVARGVARPEQQKDQRGGRSRARVLVPAVCLGLAAPIASAANYSFNAASGNPASWDTTANWLVGGTKPATVPGSDDVIIASSTTNALGVSGSRQIRAMDIDSSNSWSLLSAGSGPTLAIDRTIDMRGGGTLIIRGSGGLMPVTLSNSAGATNAITVSGSGTKLQLGAGTSTNKQLLSVTVDSGLVDIQGGTLTINANTADLNGGVHMSESDPVQFNFNQRGFTTNVAFLSGGSSAATVAMDPTVYSGESSFTSTLAINGSNSFAPATFAGQIKDSNKTGRLTALSKSGTVTQTLSGASTYTGGTSVTGGTLRADNDSALGAGAVSVTGGTLEVVAGRTISNAITLDGGTLAVNGATQTGSLTVNSGTIQGSGSIGQALDIGAGVTLSPGNSPGTLSGSSQTWSGGGHYRFEINDATGTAGGASGWDLLQLSGALTLASTSTTPFVVDITSLDAGDASGPVQHFDPSGTYEWLIASTGEAIGYLSSTDLNRFTLSHAGFDALNGSSQGTWGLTLGTETTAGGTDQQLFLTYSAVPEPGALAVMGLFALLGGRRRR